MSKVEQGAKPLSVLPEDVIAMAEQDSLSRILANAYFYRTAKTPPLEALASLAYRRSRLIWAGALAIICTVAVGVIIWLFVKRVGQVVPPPVQEQNIMLGALCASLLGGMFTWIAFNSRNDKIRLFSYWWGGFGYDLATLSQLAGLGRILTKEDDELIPQLVHDRLIDEADRFDIAEKAHLANFVAWRLSQDPVPKYPNAAREEFSRIFDAADRFGLTHPDKWKYYFQKLAERRAASQQ